MDIYSILASKPHNPHHLRRYIKFIEQCQLKNIDYEGYTEKHHICPKAKDMFPEYIDFREHAWNKAVLTARQHFIAHLMLWKVYLNRSQAFALKRMYTSNQNSGKISSKQYENLKKEHFVFKSELLSEIHRNKIADGTHNFLGSNNPVHEKVSNGTHHFLGSSNPVHEKVSNGTYHWLGPENNNKRVSEGTHPFLNKEKAKERAQKRISEGTSNFKGKVSVVDKNGNQKYISKEFYHSEENIEYVAIGSLEGYKRRNLELPKRKKETKPRKPLTDLQRKAASVRAKNRKKLECPHCGVIMDSSNYKRYHGDKCKHNNRNED